MKKITTIWLCALISALGAFTPALWAQTSPTVATLHTFSALDDNFDNGDGANPDAPLVQGRDGNFYGTTEYGGSHGSGTVFKLTSAGVLTTLHDFGVYDSNGDNGDGASPDIALVQGRDGNFYGATGYGGNGCGTVFKITPAGVLTTLHAFGARDENGNNRDGFAPAGALVQGQDGNFYGATGGGGSNGTGTIFKITPAGFLTTLYAFSMEDSSGSNRDGVSPVGALVQGQDGNFYGAAYAGGSNGQGTVFKITPAGVFTTLHNFSVRDELDANSDGAFPHAGPIQGSDGNFYGAAFTGGSYDGGTIYRITPAGKFTTLHSFTAGADGALPSTALVQGSDGDFYGITMMLSDSETAPGGTIFKITPTGALTTLYRFPNTVGYPGLEPSALVEGSDKYLYGTTYYGGSNGYGTVFRFDPRPAITSPTKATATVGHAFSYQISAGNDPTSYGATGLPKGISVAAQTGLVSGTPQTAGTFNVTLSATNVFGQSTATLSLTVAAAGTPYITSALTFGVAEDTPFTYQITATDTPTSFGVLGLPSGVTADAKTGVISGKHHGLGTVTLTLDAFNAKGKGSAYVTFQVYGAPAITNSVSAVAKDGQPFSYQIKATNHPTRYGVQGLPDGLTVDPETGLISGTHYGVGIVPLTLNAYNGAGKGSATLTLTITAN